MDDFVIPPGMSTGCLPRRSLCGAVCPLLSDHVETLPEDVLKANADVTLRPFIKTILNQDGVGSCSTESTTQSVMIARAVEGLEHVILNPWFIYHTTSGGVDRGSSIDANLEFAREHGIAPESVWPRSKGWQSAPSAEAVAAALDYRIEEFYDITTMAEARTALVLGFPVVYGAAGHSVCKIAADGTDVNSWGTTWKDGGLGVWASFERINWSYGAFAVRVAGWKVPPQFVGAMRTTI